MLSYDRLAKMASNFKCFTGLEVSEFDSLYTYVASRYDEYEEKRLWREDRERKRGAGRTFKRSLKDRLLMFTVYYRLYITSTLTGFLFEIDHSNVLRNLRHLEPLVKECMPLPKKLHERAKRAGTLKEVEEYFPGFQAFLDATEQEIPRPKSRAKRRSHYSGRHRRHTVKTQLTVNRDGVILHMTRHARGRRHDYDLFKQSRPVLPPGVRLGVDLGYDGIKDEYPELDVMIPFKRRRGGGELTVTQKGFNRRLAKARVIVEHTISRLKKFRIMGEKFRNRLRHYDTMTEIVSGLVNLRILGTKIMALT